MTRLLDYSNLRSGLLLPRLPLCWLWADDSKRGGCMYLTLLCSYLLYNTTTKGTVYVHTQARMRGVLCRSRYARRRTWQQAPVVDAIAVVEGFWPGRRDQCAVRIVRSPKTMSIALLTDWCSLDLGAVVRLLPGCLLPFDRMRGEARNSLSSRWPRGAISVHVIV